MSQEDERKFLHELANPLSIVHGNIRIMMRKLQALQAQSGHLSPEEFQERLQKAMEACERVVASLAERRKSLYEKDGKAAS
jgi:hypothetical protein